MVSRPDRIVLIALAALYEITDQAHRAPVIASLRLRALLGLLHARSSGDAAPYRVF